MCALFLAAWHNGFAGEPHPVDAIVIAKLIKLALLAGFVGLIWREIRGFL